MTNNSIPSYIFHEINLELPPDMTFSRTCLFQCWKNAYNIVCYIYKVKSPDELDYITKTTELVYWIVGLLKLCNDENTP